MKIAFGTQEQKNYVNFGINTTLFVGEVDDGECTEIYAVDILDFVPECRFQEFIHSLVKKMRHGCELVIGGSDIYESAKQILRGDHTVYESSKLLYGTQDIPKVGQYSLNVICDELLKCGLKIIAKNIDGNSMYVKATRQ